MLLMSKADDIRFHVLAILFYTVEYLFISNIAKTLGLNNYGKPDGLVSLLDKC